MNEEDKLRVVIANNAATITQFIATQIEWTKKQYEAAPTSDVKERCLDTIASLTTLLVDLVSK